MNIGRYEIMELIGGGRDIKIYRGHDPLMECDVAIKVYNLYSEEDDLYFEKDEGQSIIKRFFREASTVARLAHANIVKIYDIGSSNQSPRNISLYIAMEYVDGSLDKLIDANVPDTKTLQKRMLLFSQILEAMQCAHEYGIVHRCLKPNNVMVDREGHVKISNFHLAIVDDEPEIFSYYSSLDEGPGHFDFLYYVAPELLKDRRNMDSRTDFTL